MSAITTTAEIVEYYVNLLILQYYGKAKARATVATLTTPTIMPQTTVQTLAFSPAPTTGNFALRYPDVATTSIAWNASAGTIQTQLRGIAGLEAVVVTGSIAAGLVITLVGIPIPVLLEVTSNTLLATATPVVITSGETDEILPLAIQNGFNLIPGTTTAVGAQLDILGKYAGVLRTAPGFSQVITLTDPDFLSLIRVATAVNSLGSSLSDIQEFIYTFFRDQLLVFDYTNMHMSYLVDSSLGSQDVLQLFITQGLLPKPMGVLLSIIYGPNIANLFSFRTYDLPAFTGKPFNTYADYHMDWPWLSYANAIAF